MCQYTFLHVFHLTIVCVGVYLSFMKTMTLTQISIYIGVSKKTLYNMILDKRFDVEPIRGTKPRRWNIEDVDHWRGLNK
jgi:predicted DNA-binding transcriptional regulator AlpA